MLNSTMMFGVATMLAALVATPSLAQRIPATPDPMVGTIQAGAAHIRKMFTTAAEQMSEEDYAAKPTPDVRSFAQLIGHVAETNYWFCSTAQGEKAPVTGIEKNVTTKAALQKVLVESFDYCDRAYASMSDSSKAKALRQFRTYPMPALAVLNFRNYHSLLHWGNAITYVRLRGKVPSNENTL